jgi:anti-repressor protein
MPKRRYQKNIQYYSNLNLQTMELIKITENNGKRAVSARELYDFLGFNPSNFKSWVQNNILFNQFAIESIDYQQLVLQYELPNGATGSKSDFSLSLDFAKKLAMISKSERGEQIRNYFIECEKQLTLSQLPDFTNPAIAARAWAEQFEQRELAQKEVKALQPKAEVYDRVMASQDCVSIGDAANILKLSYGRNILFKVLREYKILMSDNTPYRKYIDAGYFKVIETAIARNERTQVVLTTLVTQRGIDYLFKILKPCT